MKPSAAILDASVHVVIHFRECGGTSSGGGTSSDWWLTTRLGFAYTYALVEQADTAQTAHAGDLEDARRCVAQMHKARSRGALHTVRSWTSGERKHRGKWTDRRFVMRLVTSTGLSCPDGRRLLDGRPIFSPSLFASAKPGYGVSGPKGLGTTARYLPALPVEGFGIGREGEGRLGGPCRVGQRLYAARHGPEVSRAPRRAESTGKHLAVLWPTSWCGQGGRAKRHRASSPSRSQCPVSFSKAETWRRQPLNRSTSDRSGVVVRRHSKPS